MLAGSANAAKCYRSATLPGEISACNSESTDAAGAKLEAALAGLEGLSKKELAKVGARVNELDREVR